MEQNKTHESINKMILTGFFVCLGLVIPYLTGHAAGVPGTVLLPMHIPVLMAGLFLGQRYGALCGFMTPVISSLLTGMPPLWPTLPMMTFELITYGFVTGLLRKKFKMPLYISLISAMILGRIASGIVFVFVMMPSGFMPVVESITGAVVTGLPGIVIQLAIIPALVKLLENRIGFGKNQELPEPDNDRSIEALIAEAVQEIKSGSCSCILIRNDQIVHRGHGPGVQPLLELMETSEDRALLENAFVVDKIIGKAAAMIFVLGNIAGAYGITISINGKKYLEKHGKDCRSERCVDAISDRTGQGICPIERSVLEIDDPQEGYQVIAATRKALLQGKIS